MVKALKRRRLTLDQIMEAWELSRSTAFRWLQQAEADGHDLVRRGSDPRTYQIIEG